MASCSSSTGSGNTGGTYGSGGSNGTGSGGQTTGAGGSTGSGDGGSNGTGSGGSNNTGAGGSASGNGGSTGSGGVVGTGGSNPTGKGGSTGSGGSNPTGSGGSNPTGSGGSNSTGSGGSAPTQPTLVTSASGAYWKTDGTLTAGTGSGTVTVNDSGTKQNWEGMGGAFNEIGWQQIQMLSSDDQAKVIDLLFGTDGANFSIGRIPIGASDYALTRYTEDETSGDTSLSSFSISRDMMYLIPFVKAAQKVKPSLRLWGSPWTPPTWMKTRSGSVTNGSVTTSCGNPSGSSDSNAFDGGCMNATSANLTAYAQYFAKWVSAYAGQQITIEAVAPQNEPDYSQGYPSCLWKASDYVAFVPMLSQAVSSMGTKVMLGTMSNGDNGQQSADLAVANSVMADSTAKSIPKMVGLQWGMLDIFSSNASWLNIGSLPVWATEHKCGNYPWNPSGYPKYVEPAPNDQAYAVESWGYIDKAIKAGVTAYNAWNMVLDGVGKGNDMIRQWAQDTLLTVKPSKCNGTSVSSSLCATPTYFVFRHVGQFAQPGGHVLTTSGGDAIAFKNPDGSEVAVMYNSGGANSSYSVSIAGKKYTFSMPAQGWATVFVPAGS